MNRREARYLAVFALYHFDIQPNSLEDSFLTAISFGEELLGFEDQDYEFSRTLVQETIAHLDSIDGMITAHLVGWTIDRLSYVDRAILRLAVYEMMFTDTPFAIVINEALEITKVFSALDDDKQTKFNNKVLDGIRKELKR